MKPTYDILQENARLRDLLGRYALHVLYCEGVSFTDPCFVMTHVNASEPVLSVDECKEIEAEMARSKVRYEGDIQ